MAIKRVLFVGLGHMGHPMVQNVVSGGFEVWGHDADPGWRELPGLERLKGLDDLSEPVDCIITMLPTTQIVVKALLEEGLIDRLRPDGYIVDMSSGDPAPYDELAQAARRRSLSVIDAPVSGGIVGAEQGTLSIMAGADEDTLEAVRPLLKSMGEHINHMGELGAGQVTKLCNQVMVAMHLQALMEGFSLAKAGGLDLEKLREVLMGGAAASWMLDIMGPRVLRDDSDAGFKIDLQLKDLKVATDYAYQNRVVLPGTAQAMALYLEAGAHGEGNNGNQALYKVYERLNARKLRRR